MKKATIMQEELIKYATAVLAKENGFNIETKHWYDQTETLNPCGAIRGAMCYENVGYAPTQSLLQKWLRDEYGINISIMFSDLDDHLHRTTYKYQLFTGKSPRVQTSNFKTYEEALEDALVEGLKLIKK